MDADGLEPDHSNEAPWCDLDLFRKVLPEIESHPSRIVQQYFSHYIHFDRNAFDPSSSSGARDTLKGCVYVYEALLSLPPHMYVISKKLRGRTATTEDVTTALYLILDGFVFHCSSLSSVVHARACQMGHFSREALEALDRDSSWDPFEGTTSKSDKAGAPVQSTSPNYDELIPLCATVMEEDSGGQPLFISVAAYRAELQRRQLLNP